jgi:hypothetical protein
VTDVVWEDPPPLDRERGENGWMHELIAACRQHPGRWAKAKTYSAKSSATTMASRTRRGFADVEAAVRVSGDEFVLYVRSNPK